MKKVSLLQHERALGEVLDNALKMYRSLSALDEVVAMGVRSPERALKEYDRALKALASPWQFTVDAVIYHIRWLSLMDVRTIKHPHIKGCMTGVHGRQTKPFLLALIALATAQTTKQTNAAEARVQRARKALLAAIETDK